MIVNKDPTQVTSHFTGTSVPLSIILIQLQISSFELRGVHTFRELKLYFLFQLKKADKCFKLFLSTTNYLQNQVWHVSINISYLHKQPPDIACRVEKSFH